MTEIQKCKCGKLLGKLVAVTSSENEYYDHGIIQRREDAPTNHIVNEPICYECIINVKDELKYHP